MADKEVRLTQAQSHGQEAEVPASEASFCDPELCALLCVPTVLAMLQNAGGWSGRLGKNV